MNDEGSALRPGVNISSLPRKSIWDEVVTLPENGEIIALNGREIYSIPDLYQAISEHGLSKAAGVHVPIKLTMLAVSTTSQLSEYTGDVRLLFVPRASQNFDTNVDGFSEGLKSGFTAGTPAVKCLGKAGILGTWNLIAIAAKRAGLTDKNRTVGIEGYEDCKWRSYQQASYAKQFYSRDFSNTELLTMIIPMSRIAKVASVATATKAARGANALRVGSILKNAAVEGMLDGVWALGMQPPTTPIRNRLYEVPAAAGFGFVSSVVIDVIVR